MINQSLSQHRGLPVICIQEAGTVQTQREDFTRQASYDYKTFPPYERIASRCNMGILTPRGTRDRYDVYPCSATQYNRPLVCVNVNSSLIIANIHATATHNVAIHDILGAIETLQSFNLPWILIGDMNYNSHTLRTYFINANIFTRRVIAPGRPTHIHGGRYDYAVQDTYVFPQLQLSGIMSYTAGSDHHPVIFDT